MPFSSWAAFLTVAAVAILWVAILRESRGPKIDPREKAWEDAQRYGTAEPTMVNSTAKARVVTKASEAGRSSGSAPTSATRSMR